MTVSELSTDLQTLEMHGYGDKAVSADGLGEVLSCHVSQFGRVELTRYPDAPLLPLSTQQAQACAVATGTKAGIERRLEILDKIVRLSDAYEATDREDEMPLVNFIHKVRAEL